MHGWARGTPSGGALDPKGDNVMRTQTRGGAPAVLLINVGVPVPALHRGGAEEVSPSTERCGPFTSGPMCTPWGACPVSTHTCRHTQPCAGTLQVLASHGLAEDSRDLPRAH